MTTKMTRRTFLKGAAAAAAAVSLSGLLTGCGGGQLADNEVQIGPFIVKVYGLDVNLGTVSGNNKGAITGKVKLRYDAGGSSCNDHYHQQHNGCALPDETRRQQFCCHPGRLIGSRTLCPGHSGKSARGFLPFCPGAEGWFWAVFPAM